MTAEVTAIYSRNGKLNTEMTLDDLKAASYESEKKKNKAISIFVKADKNNDGQLNADEIKAYDRKQTWKTIGIIAGSVAVAALTAFAVYKGVQAHKELKSLRSELNSTRSELNSTSERLKNAELELVTDRLPDGTIRRYTDKTKTTLLEEYLPDGTKKEYYSSGIIRSERSSYVDIIDEDPKCMTGRGWHTKNRTNFKLYYENGILKKESYGDGAVVKIYAEDGRVQSITEDGRPITEERFLYLKSINPDWK